VYAILVLLLISQYTKKDGWMWFLLLQATYTSVVFGVRQVFPGFVARTANLNMFKSAKPVLFATEVVHVFVLGMQWNHYHSIGAAFDIFFPILLTLKVMEAIALSLVTNSKTNST